jgi:curved DNA-binding protein CbpA
MWRLLFILLITTLNHSPLRAEDSPPAPKIPMKRAILFEGFYFDPYQALNVSPDSSDERIKKAYRFLMQKYHPDRNPAPDSVFKDLNASKKERLARIVRFYYELLSARREDVDHYMKEYRPANTVEHLVRNLEMLNYLGPEEKAAKKPKFKSKWARPESPPQAETPPQTETPESTVQDSTKTSPNTEPPVDPQPKKNEEPPPRPEPRSKWARSDPEAPAEPEPIPMEQKLSRTQKKGAQLYKDIVCPKLFGIFVNEVVK